MSWTVRREEFYQIRVIPLKDKIKKYGKVPAIISAVLSAIVYTWSLYFYITTQTNIILSLISSSVVFIISFVYCFVVVGVVWAIICAVRHIKKKNKVPPPNPQTEKYLESVKPLSEPVESQSSKSLSKTSKEEPPTPIPNSKSSATQEDKKYDIVLPSGIDDAKLVYHYESEKAKNVDYDLAMKIAGQKEWELDASIIDNEVWLTTKEKPIMQLASKRRSDMLADWIKRGDPYKIYLANINTETKEVHIFIAFYRSVDSMMKGRESQVVKLTSYSSEEKQEAIALLNENDELDIEVDYTDDGDEIYNVVSMGEPIGKLPKKIVRRLEEEDFAKCIVDHIDFDENDRYVPYIKIYW